MKLYWRYKKDGKWTWKKAQLTSAAIVRAMSNPEEEE